MITVYQQQDGKILARDLEQKELLPAKALWIDIIHPTDEELEAIEQQLGIEIPSKKEIWKNHVLNRQYVQGGVAYMTAAIIMKVGMPFPDTSAVTFILSPDYLLTVRYILPTSFITFGQRMQSHCTDFQTPGQTLEGLLEEIITRVAHNSEIVVQTLDDISHGIFCGQALEEKRAHGQVMKEVLKRLGTSADLNSKINESLHSISRMLSFFKQVVPHDSELDQALDILVTDAHSLTKQTAFLSDKITFQLDALLGMINVEQNLIIKIFSVVTVFFLPPTLVSSLYGMNFHHMPELDWQWGYPLAITMMLVCAIVPYLYFRRKGWL